MAPVSGLADQFMVHLPAKESDISLVISWWRQQNRSKDQWILDLHTLTRCPEMQLQMCDNVAQCLQNV